MKTIEPGRLAARIIKHLYEMDCEADQPARGFPTGLNWYGGFTRPDLTRPRTEPEWSRRLAEQLRGDQIAANAEVGYPDKPRTKCDLVIAAGDESFWIEIKGSWKEYCHKSGTMGNYYSYLLHPLVAGLDKTKSHTAAIDVQRVSTLAPDAATWIGFLLVGFDSLQRPMETEVLQLANLSGISKLPWHCVSSSWPDPYRPNEHVKCWFWYRRNEKIGGS